MPSRSKMLGNGAIGRQKTLGLFFSCRSRHTIFPLARWSMRILTAVVEIATLPVFHAGQDLVLRGAVALELVGNDYPRHVLQALEQVMALPVDGQEHLVQVPLVPWLGASVLQLIRVRLPKLPTPLADSLMGHVDATLEQDLLYVAVAQREAIIEPDAMADDLAGKAMVLVAFGVSGWRHVGCLF